MPQETNLNVAPYFDDFDPQSNYYKVLFKPGYPVQARELNNLQSVLQNQVEDVGNHLFKEGAQVIPGNINYNPEFYAIQIQEEFLGVPVSLYLDQIVGKNITGRTSGVTARVVTYINNQESERGNYTLYVNYFNSSSTDAATQTFFDNEILVTESSINYATTFISAGEGFANTLATDASAVASAFTLSSGVYFLRGHFVDVADQILILDQYSNSPSYRIGLNVAEDIISADVDPTLTDNAQGFNNYSAPGADRLKITATLSKKAPNDYEDNNFVQLTEVTNGILRSDINKTEYNRLSDELARRTFDESGNYYVKEFTVSVRESLNDGEGNRGIYEEGQITSQGQVPNDDLAIYRISPGKAYVKGYEVDIRNTTLLDVPKPRTTRLVENQAINFGFGPTIAVNNVFGSATIGFNTSNTLSLRDQRVGIDGTASGKEIGVARIYDFALESGSYDAINSKINQWDLSLFDVQTYTEFTVNTNVTLTTPTYIRGESSGATGYLRYAVSAGTAFTAYGVQGNFFIGENLIFNGVADNDRYISDIKNYETSDVQSVYGIVGFANTFTADLIPSPVLSIGNATITAGDVVTGISTVTSPVTSFIGIVTSGNLVRYTLSGNTVPTLGRVTSVDATSLTIVGVSSVTGFCDGAVPSTTTTVNDFTLVESKIQRNSGNGNDANNQSLYSIFPKRNIASVDLTGADLTIRRQFSTTISAAGETPAIDAGDNEVFLPFDEERYSLIRSDGSTEVLTSDRVNLSNGSTTIQITGLSGADASGTILIATLRKSNITSKIKRKSISNALIVDKSKNSYSGTGTSTLNDGLLYGNYPFGTRVQDSVICLNVPDVVEIHGIYESNSTSNPESPFMTTASMDGPSATTNDLIIGETLTGSISGAKGLYVTRKTDTSIGFIYLNNTPFEPNELINFSQSGVSAVAANITATSKNITNNYSFFNGQRESIYDYSRIIRKPEFPAPTRKIIVYYSKAYYDAADTGDITTVNSYNSFNYTTEINSINGVRNTDVIDARPRVKEYTVTAGGRSPLEFYGRSFDGGASGQHSSKNIIASDESLTLGYNYYLGRADRVYLSPDGGLSIKYGSPDDDPKLPDEVSDSLNIANIFLPAYLYDTSQAKLQFIQHKRYQMRDISKLEKRIKNLEYYSSLSLIETNTLNLFIPDNNGLNRFKSGIFVDNFSTTEAQDSSVGIRNSIDTKNRVLRPAHYSTAFNMQIGSSAIAGIGTTTAANQDSRFAQVLGSSIKRTNQTVTLDYSEVPWLNQPFATRSESVTPFLIRFWDGSIELSPSVDVWIDVNRMEVRNVENEGSFAAIAGMLEAEVTSAEDGSRIGVTPVVWDSWETVGVNVDLNVRTATNQRVAPPAGFGAPWGAVATVNTITNTVAIDQQRSGSQTTVTEVINTETLGDRVVSREIIHFMRSRNIQFTGTKLKPYTQVYSFFDGVDVNKFSFNKLVEIEMLQGIFEIGETVNSLVNFRNIGELNDEVTNSSARIGFRVAQSNHKYGPYNAPTDFYDQNPYDRNNTIPTDYSETSTILNVDTFSLSSEEFPGFDGYITPGMILIGRSSGARARVTNVRLITDRLGTLIGSFRVPDSSDIKNPIFETGRSTFRLTSSPVNSSITGTTTTSAEEIFYSEGSIDNTQEVTLSLRNARVDVNSEFFEQRQLSDNATGNVITDLRALPPPPPPPGPPSPPPRGRDPLAQTFFVDDTTGIFLTKVEVFFNAKDDNVPVTCQIRETNLGTPSSVILPYSEVDLSPDQVNLSDDGSIPTVFEFESPVYLNGETEYAIVLLSNSTEYRVWISRLGEPDITTAGQEFGQILVSKQPILGSLFKSQNASVWTPSQYEDLKFNLYRADFVAQGAVEFFNPELPTSLSSIPKGGLTINSRNISVGIGTTVQDAGLVVGNTIIQNGSNGTGNLVGFAGSATSTLTITNAGVGYTPSSGSYTFAGVALTSVTGSGINATANIYIENGVAIGATIENGGKGYAIGDVLRPIQVGNSLLGRNMKLTVDSILGNNELIIDQVQGEFLTGPLNYLQYINSSGITTTLNSTVGGNVIPVSPIRVNTDGVHLKIFQRNHGMHSRINQVTLSDINSNITPSPLSVTYSSTSTGEISIASTSNFGSFENLGIGTTNPGYAKIGDEIIEYTGVSANTLTGITRGIDNTVISTHDSGELVYKYELGGVSLRRINTTHDLTEVTIRNPITLDTYHVKVDMSTNGTDRSSGSPLGALYFNESTSAGGNGSKGSYNLPFSLIVPKYTTIEPKGCNVISQVRTITQTSISGGEASYADRGYQEIANYQKNYFDTPRMVASQVNENAYLSTLPGNKSFGMSLNLFTYDRRLTPAIDLDHSSVVFVTNRINSPVTDYANDPRVNTVSEDPHNFMYVSKNVILENPASSLKVYLDAYVSNYNDVRVFYALNQDTTANETVFVPFPGYGNFDIDGNIISNANSNGTSDVFIPKTDVYTVEPTLDLFREYTFTADRIPPFTSFRIKIVGTSTNQAIVPQFRNLRAVALA